MLKKSKVLFLFLFAMLVISNVFLYSNTEFLFTQNNNDKGELKQILFEHLKFSNSTLDKDLSNLLASVLEISEQRKEQTTHEKNVREIQRHLQVIHSLFDDKNSSHIQPDMKAVSDAKENNNNNSNRTLCPLSTLPSWRENNIPISNFNVKSEEMIGVNLIDQFRNSKIEYCVPRDDSADNNQMNSKITCFSNFLGEKFCEGENLLIDFTKIRENSKNRHVSLATGALLGNCNLDSSFNAETLFNYSTKTIMSSFESKDHLQCKEIIDTPTYFVSRYEYANVYHTMTDFANAFLASLVTQTKIENWQIVLFDFHAEVPLDEGWKDIFSPNREVKRVSDLIQHSNQIGGPICYRKAIFSLPGYLSPFRGTLQPFVHGDFFKAFSNFVKDKYHVLNSDAPLSPTITLISRHNYQTSPRKNDTKINRKFMNENEVENALIGYDHNIIDPASMSLRDQVIAMRKTNILIGAHGAGLTLLLFLPEEAVVLEFQTFDSDFHFRFLAKSMGYTYLAFPQKIGRFDEFIPVDILPFKQMLKHATAVAKEFGMGERYPHITSTSEEEEKEIKIL